MTFEHLKAEAASHIHSAMGEPVTYHYSEGRSTAFCAIFVMAAVQIGMGGEVPIDSRQPMCSIRGCDLQRKPRQGDLITRRNVTYEVKSVQSELDASWRCLLWAVDERHASQARDRT